MSDTEKEPDTSSLPQLVNDDDGNSVEGESKGNSSSTTMYKYRDFGNVPEDQDVDSSSPEAASPPRSGSIESSIRVQKFPVKLYAILAQKEFHDVITWMPHGRSWKVLKPNLFESLVMPLFFEYSNYHSFNRLVNAWSFRRISSGPDRGSYYHELFLRGKPHLQKYMRRLPKTHKKLPMKKEDEPDFYGLDKQNPLPSLEDVPLPPGSSAGSVGPNGPGGGGGMRGHPHHGMGGMGGMGGGPGSMGGMGGGPGSMGGPGGMGMGGMGGPPGMGMGGMGMGGMGSGMGGMGGMGSMSGMGSGMGGMGSMGPGGMSGMGGMGPGGMGGMGGMSGMGGMGGMGSMHHQGSYGGGGGSFMSPMHSSSMGGPSPNSVGADLSYHSHHKGGFNDASSTGSGREMGMPSPRNGMGGGMPGNMRGDPLGNGSGHGSSTSVGSEFGGSGHGPNEFRLRQLQQMQAYERRMAGAGADYGGMPSDGVMSRRSRQQC